MKKFTIFKTALSSVLLLLSFSMVAHAQCTLSEDFEASVWASTSYAVRTVVDDLGEWTVTGVGNMDANDRYHDERSIRLRGNSGDNCYIQMNFDKANGIGEASFYYASYSSHSGGIIVLYYSTDGGTNWTNAGSVTAPAWSGEMLQASFALNVQGNVRVKVVREGDLTGSKTVNVDDLCLTDFTATNTVATPTFLPYGGSYFTPQNVTINCATEGATIHYTTNGTDPTVSSPVFSSPINVSTTTTIKAMAVKAGMDNSSIATAVYSFPVEVPNIAAFKAANSSTNSTLYRITGDVVFVFKNGRNIYIKDATGGLLIFDNTTPVITNEYNEGDVISGGIVGSCTIYNGLYEMIPALNPAPGVPGAPVTPTAVTMATLLENFATYESQLIRLENVTFDEGTFGTGAAGNIAIYQNEDEMICRNHYGTITDYTPDPNKHYNVIGFAIPFNLDRQIAPRNLGDIIPIESIIPVADIINVPATAAINVPLTLTGTVLPANATFQTIEWTVKDAGGTGAVIAGNIFTATETGTAKITATIVNGLNFGSNYTQDFTIEVVETITYYTITATVNNSAFGVITPSGEIEVEEGASKTFNITPYANYRINDVLVNGESKGAITTYTFNNVQSDATIHVIFDVLSVDDNEFSNVFVYSYQNTIVIKNVETALSAEIFDMMGRLIYQSNISAETVITLQAPNGVYFVKLISSERQSVPRKISVMK